MELVKDIAAIIGCILSLITLSTICSKGCRAMVARLFTRNTQEIQNENLQQTKDIKEIQETLNIVSIKMDGFEECLRQQCRNTIKNIYYRYQSNRTIPLYERKTVDKTYDIYTNVFHGNSYASLLYHEICKWDIEPASKDDIEEE